MWLHVLTVILVTLRALDYITLSYWWCIAPSMVAIGIVLFLVGIAGSFFGLAAWLENRKS